MRKWGDRRKLWIQGKGEGPRGGRVRGSAVQEVWGAGVWGGGGGGGGGGGVGGGWRDLKEKLYVIVHTRGRRRDTVKVDRAKRGLRIRT